MKVIERITFDPDVMGGKPCIRGLRVTVGTLVGLVASGHTKEAIPEMYPYLEKEDIDQALSYQDSSSAIGNLDRTGTVHFA